MQKPKKVVLAYSGGLDTLSLTHILTLPTSDLV